MSYEPRSQYDTIFKSAKVSNGFEKEVLTIATEGHGCKALTRHLVLFKSKQGHESRKVLLDCLSICLPNISLRDTSAVTGKHTELYSLHTYFGGYRPAVELLGVLTSNLKPTN